MGDFESDTQIEMMKIVQAMHNYEWEYAHCTKSNPSDSKACF